MCLAEPEPRAEVARRAEDMVKKYDLPFMALHASECLACVGRARAAKPPASAPRS